jgi:hypothetical protein
MQNQTVPRPHGVPESFYSKFGSQITAVLSGFDRIRFRATLRMLYRPGMMDRYLAYCGVGLNKFKEFAESTTAKIKAASRGDHRLRLFGCIVLRANEKETF